MYQTAPCTRGWSCKAYCCGIFTLWNRDAFSSAEEIGIFRRYDCNIVKLVGSRDSGFYIFPPLNIFQNIGQEITEHERGWIEREAVKHCLRKKIQWIRCIFLNRENRCSIHEHRPMACRMFGTSLMPDCPIMEGSYFITF